jgi:putative ATPase
MDLFDAHERKQRARRAPLAERMRPGHLEDLIGLDDLLGQNARLRRFLTSRRLVSLILWGPPGSGKTTLARLLAKRGGEYLVKLSAVSSGVKDIRAVVASARDRAKMDGRGTVLFIDEIHRFNKGQQDALLPHVEDGTLVLIGATTENPAFEVNRPLLSRCHLITLPGLSEDALVNILERAFKDAQGGLGCFGLDIEDGTFGIIARLSGGDARKALNLLEATALAALGENDSGGTLTHELLIDIAQKPATNYDKSGEGHFNAISAFHKSLRGSDPDGALYWMMRMVEGGEDLMYIARRMVRFASEDVGLADPGALTRAVAALEAARFLGRPEGDLALVQMALDLALAPKSNAMELAYYRARDDVRELGSPPVPLHLRNVKVGLTKAEKVGARYLYAHDYKHGVVPQRYLPTEVEDESVRRPYYRPTDREQAFQDRIALLEAQLEEARKIGHKNWKLEEKP